MNIVDKTRRIAKYKQFVALVDGLFWGYIAFERDYFFIYAQHLWCGKEINFSYILSIKGRTFLE